MEEEAVQLFQKKEWVQVLPNKDLVKCQIESYRHIGFIYFDAKARRFDWTIEYLDTS